MPDIDTLMDHEKRIATVESLISRNTEELAALREDVKGQLAGLRAELKTWRQMAIAKAIVMAVLVGYGINSAPHLAKIIIPILMKSSGGM